VSIVCMCRAHPYSLRIDTILQWLNSSTNGARPSLATVHLDGVDEIGRFDGPDSQQVCYQPVSASAVFSTALIH